MLDYFNELRWAVQAYRLADANPAKVASLVVLSLLVAILDSIGLSVLLPVLVYLQGGTEALATKLPFPFDRMYAYSAPYIAGYELFAMVAAAISILCVRYWIYYAQQKRAILMGTRSVSVLRRNIHQAFLESDISFHTRRHAGTRYTAVYTYAQQVGGIIIMLFQALVGGLVCLAYVLLLFYVSPLMALATVPILGFILLAYRAMLERGKKASVEYNLHTAKLNDALTEHFQGVRIIKLHNREERTADSFSAITDKNLALYARVLLIQALAGATINPILLIAGVGLIYVSMSVLSVDLAVLGTFAVVMFRLLPLLGSLNTLRAGLHAYGPSLDLYFQALSEARQERTILPGKRAFTGLAQGIELQDIGFRYPDADLVALNGASMRIPAGAVVAVVGRSGAGKSTIVDLLARLYDPTTGRILVDGVPLTELDLGSYRASVALVSQEQFLFDATVRENVSFGLDRVLDDAAMEDVLRRAHALEFVRAMPESFDTRVGERGVMLSGGQRQRLALARALASNPKLLILDEPTSALDSESEQAIQLALAELRGEITILIVAHRFATIRDCDLIHVVKDGQVVASGSHATLWRDNEHYRHLSELQAA